MTDGNVNEAATSRTAQAQPGYDAWFDEVKRIAWLMAWSPTAIESIDKLAWKEYFDNGFTPAEAWREDLDAAAS